MRINLKQTLFILPVFFMLPVIFSESVLADTPVVTGVQAIEDQATQVSTDPQDNIALANEWGLTLKEYQRYTWLMASTPNGHWYKDLDPAEVLALNATNEAEMMAFAKIQAQNMHERVSRELAFNKLYSMAYRQEYPNEQAVQSEVATGVKHAELQAGDHIWLFLKPNTPLGPFVYEHLMSVIAATPGITLDLYFVGNHVSAKAIQAWAKKNGVLTRLINKEVTLNYGNDRFAKVSSDSHPSLPFIGLVHGGQFQSITLSSVLS